MDEREVIEAKKIMAHIEKYQAIVRFKDSTLESPWYYSEIYAKQFAEQYFDEDNYVGYSINTEIVKEDLNAIPTKGKHPVYGK